MIYEYWIITKERKKSGDIVKEVKSDLQQEWSSYLQINIDGSKDLESGKVAFRVTIPELRIKNAHRISDQIVCVLVFTAGMLAIFCALWWIEDNKPHNSIISSDSAEALPTMRQIKSKSRPLYIERDLSNTYRIQGRVLNSWTFVSINFLFWNEPRDIKYGALKKRKRFCHSIWEKKGIRAFSDKVEFIEKGFFFLEKEPPI